MSLKRPTSTSKSQETRAAVAAGAAKRVAVLGAGAMGLGVARSLKRAGLDVVGYDPSAAAKTGLVEAGVESAASAAAAAADADVLVVTVVNAEQTRSAVLGPGGAAKAMKPDGVVVASATIAPDAARALAQEVEALGLAYLDAPISGGAAKSAKGELTVMASGKPAAFERARPVLEAMATTVYELGAEAGIGSSFKLVNQLLAGVHIAAACEAIAFAKRLGLDLEMVYKVITSSAGNSWMFENRVPHVLAGDYRPLSAVAIFTKDLGIASDVGRASNFPLPMAATALQMFLMTAAAGMGRDDDASVARLFAQIAGLELPAALREP
ncbi:MAG: L-threonate dehydrogenase [Roseiarcus sp.]|jgi:3-hydroxyisobutyrate dehydrogenase